MRLEEALPAFLLSRPELVAVDAVIDRIHPGRIPQGDELPAVLFKRRTSGAQQDLDGDAGWADPIFEIQVWGESYTSCKDVSQIVFNVLNCYSGMMGDLQMMIVVPEDEEDQFSDPVQAGDIASWLAELSFTFQHHTR